MRPTGAPSGPTFVTTVTPVAKRAERVAKVARIERLARSPDVLAITASAGRARCPSMDLPAVDAATSHASA